MSTNEPIPILLDDREDPAIADQIARYGVPVTICRLDYGDLAIKGVDGLMIGYEHKRLTDLIDCMKSRRLSGHQLRGMRDMYDRYELVIEGIWRAGDNDSIEVPQRDRNGKTTWGPMYHLRSGVSYRQVDSYLYSQYECGGVPCWKTQSIVETAHLYVSRWHWWQKPYHLHKSHEALYSNNPSAQRRGALTLFNGDANAVTLCAAQIPGIDAKSWDVGKHFSSVQEMCNATAGDWCRVEWTDRSGNTKRFGKALAKEIVQWLKGSVINA